MHLNIQPKIGTDKQGLPDKCGRLTNMKEKDQGKSEPQTQETIVEMQRTEEIFFFFNSNQTPSEFLNDIVTLETRIRIYQNGIGHMISSS